jgi:hypothetical protein
MADEITVSVSVVANKGNHAYSRKLTDSFDMATGRGGNPGVVTVLTTETAITFGSLVAPRWAVFKNLDATNYVDIGPDSSGLKNFIRLQPGEFACLPLAPSVSIKGKANTASVDVLVEVQET